MQLTRGSLQQIEQQVGEVCEVIVQGREVARVGGCGN